MFPQFIFLSSLASQYDQQIESLMKSSRFEHNVNQSHSKQILSLNMNQKYLDSPLFESSLKSIQKLKQQLFKYEKYDTVVVAPLQKSLKTCYEMFRNYTKKSVENSVKDQNQKKDIHFYIEPLLGDRLNSTHAIGDMSESRHKQDYSKFTQFYDQFPQRVQKSQWVYSLLPPRVVKQLPNNIGLTSASQYIKLLKSTQQKKNPQQQNCLQTQLQFSQRIQKLKDALLGYQHMSGSGKKVLVIASSQVLNHLAATDFHQNGQPVNQLRLSSGQHDLVSLVVNGFDIIRQLQSQSILPFCR